MGFGVIYFPQIKKNDSLGFFFQLGKTSSFFIEYFASQNIVIGLHKNLYEPKNLWISLEIPTMPSGGSFICIKMMSDSKNGLEEQSWKADLKDIVFKEVRLLTSEDWRLNIALPSSPYVFLKLLWH